jgi:TctA family transporter
LTAAAVGSFFAGTIATVILALFAPPLAAVALKFGPAEFFSLMVLGLLASIVLARGSLLHALVMPLGNAGVPGPHQPGGGEESCVKRKNLK